MVRFPGIYVAVVTPFTDNDEVDEPRLREHVDWLIANGIHGLVPTGSVGEYASLSDPERARVVETIIDTAARRVPVVVGAAASSTAKTLSWCRHARQAGAEGLMLLPPISYRPSRREVIAYYQTLAQADLPIICYNNPVDYNTDLTPDLLAELATIEQVVGVKEFSGDARRVPAILQSTRLEVLAGVDDLVLEAFLAGATGWIAGLTNVLPAESVQLYDLAMAGNVAEAWRLYRRLLPLFRYDAMPILVQVIKYGCQLIGRPMGTTRAPRLSLEPEQLRQVEDALALARPVGATT